MSQLVDLFQHLLGKCKIGFVGFINMCNYKKYHLRRHAMGQGKFKTLYRTIECWVYLTVAGQASGYLFMNLYDTGVTKT